MSVEFDWGVACDAELVNAAALGDRTAFAGIYDRYADRLHHYCLGIVGDRDAADCVQEAFCVAVTDLPSLRHPDKLRPWLYAIARNQAFRMLRDRRREMTSDDPPDVPSQAAGPETLVRRNELTDLIATAEGGLSDRDREVLNLAYRHGLSGAELAQALGVGDDAAKKMVQRLRVTVERSVGALLIAPARPAPATTAVVSWRRWWRIGTVSSRCSCASACRATSTPARTATRLAEGSSAPCLCWALLRC